MRKSEAADLDAGLGARDYTGKKRVVAEQVEVGFALELAVGKDVLDRQAVAGGPGQRVDDLELVADRLRVRQAVRYRPEAGRGFTRHLRDRLVAEERLV